MLAGVQLQPTGGWAAVGTGAALQRSGRQHTVRQQPYCRRTTRVRIILNLINNNLITSILFCLQKFEMINGLLKEKKA